MNKFIPIITGLLLMTLTLKKGISAKGIKLLKILEGEKFVVYDDVGHKAVGVGHNIVPLDNLNIGDRITPQQSKKFLRNDLNIAEKAIKNNVSVPLNQNQFDALVLFVFNIGVNAFLYINNGEPSTLLKKLNEYDYSGAQAEFPRWKFVTINGVKQINAGLIKRRQFEQDLFNA